MIDLTRRPVNLLAAALILIAGLPGSLLGQRPSGTADAALMYEISGPGIEQPSYLFGTIHMICSKDMFPAERLDNHLSKSKRLLLEIDLDDPLVMQAVIAGSMLSDGKQVKDLVSPEQYAQIDATFKAYLGISFDLLQRFKPAASSTYLMTSPKIIGCQSPTVYDRYLAEAATGKRIPVLGLESAANQIAVIDSIPLDKQLRDLLKTANDPATDANKFKRLYSTYLSQDPHVLYAFTIDAMKEADYPKEKMLDERNVRWIPAIEKAIREMPTFVAVGAGHLGGEKGVVALLRAKGLKLTPIRF